MPPRTTLLEKVYFYIPNETRLASIQMLGFRKEFTRWLLMSMIKVNNGIRPAFVSVKVDNRSSSFLLLQAM